MTQNEKLKELFEKIKNETATGRTNKSELDEAVEKMGAQEFCDWVDEWLNIMKEEEKVVCPHESSTHARTSFMGRPQNPIS